MEDTFFPESIGSADATVDLQEIIEAVQAGKSQLGKSREAQAEHRRKAFEDMTKKALKGRAGIGNR